MKKVYQIMPILLMIIFVTGCSKSELTLRINNNGSADFTYRHEVTAAAGKEVSDFGVDKAVLGDTSKEALLKHATAKGYTTEALAGAKQGFVARKHVEDFRHLLKSEQELPFPLPKGFWRSNGLTYREGLFYNTYAYEASLDWSLLGIDEAQKSAETEEPEVSELVIEEPVQETKASVAKPVITLSLNLPIEVTTANATLIGSEGRNLTWELVPGETKAVNFTAKELNYYSLVYASVLVIGFICIASGIYFLLYRKA